MVLVVFRVVLDILFGGAGSTPVTVTDVAGSVAHIMRDLFVDSCSPVLQLWEGQLTKIIFGLISTAAPKLTNQQMYLFMCSVSEKLTVNKQTRRKRRRRPH